MRCRMVGIKRHRVGQRLASAAKTRLLEAIQRRNRPQHQIVGGDVMRWAGRGAAAFVEQQLRIHLCDGLSGDFILQCENVPCVTVEAPAPDNGAAGAKVQ